MVTARLQVVIFKWERGEMDLKYEENDFEGRKMREKENLWRNGKLFSSSGRGGEERGWRPGGVRGATGKKRKQSF